MIEAEYGGTVGWAVTSERTIRADGEDEIGFVMGVNDAVRLRDLVESAAGFYDLYSVLVKLLPGNKFKRQERFCVSRWRANSTAC